ncbi:interleukin-1 receptor-associated kinase 1-binding protein 1 homolog isoform X3 [Narcine bancroftii]|uniref:interleukin-1 receptor-associated kinase 1-binding protein 1 homolog isoform X3 n=1 Tax=Narcine bancroftii TaxID=1343680 RepID=UPI0038318E60
MSKENNITVTKDFRRIENGYQMEAEICVIFSDFGKMEDFCNLLVEKLDSTVVVGSPQFFHTNKTMENIRLLSLYYLEVHLHSIMWVHFLQP